MQAHSHRRLTRARVLAVRGRLTLDRLECASREEVVLGDGGLAILLQLRQVSC